MRVLLFLLLIRAALLGWVMSQEMIGLAPDEAQYWTWSQALDWGYYSKPPGIAWQIYLTTSLLGNTLLGVRLGALIMGSGLSFAVYAVARAARLEKRTAFWAAVVTMVSPLGVYLSIVATTDGGAILFLTLAIVAIMRGPSYGLTGLCILAGGLFKWTAFFFWPVVLLGLIFYKSLRKWSLVGGILLSLCAFLPSVYWNSGHEWATFKHVGTTLVHISQGNFFDFLGAQILLLSPVYFILLIASYFYIQEKRQLWIAATFPVFVLFYMGLAFFKKMQPNWAAFLYPPGFALIAWMGCERLNKRGMIYLHVGTVLALLMVMTAFAIPWLQQSGILLSYKLNPFRQSVGWDRLASALIQTGYNPENDFLFADKYQNVSLLSFYAPGQKRAYYFNISHSRKTQFSYWPQMQEKEGGKTGFFVVLENISSPDATAWYINHYTKRLHPYFEKIVYKGAYPLFSVGEVPVKYALIFECDHYLGQAPPEGRVAKGGWSGDGAVGDVPMLMRDLCL
jgi:4-amino-4-deoxy-L-arabinose transferase-like glycosyltransferase